MKVNVVCGCESLKVRGEIGFDLSIDYPFPKFLSMQ